MGVPPYHPCLFGIFHEKVTILSSLGVPPSWGFNQQLIISPYGFLVVDNPKTYTEMIYGFGTLYSIWLVGAT